MTNTKPDHDETLRQKLDRVADDEYYGPESQNKPIVDRGGCQAGLDLVQPS